MMMLRFSAPSFMPLAAPETFNEKVNTYNVQHNSLFAPTFLKEQDLLPASHRRCQNKASNVQEIRQTGS